MGLSKKGGAILALSLSVAVFAIVWPVDYIPHGIKIAFEKAVCPLVRRIQFTNPYSVWCHATWPHGGMAWGSQSYKKCVSPELSTIMQGYGSDFQGSLPEDHPPVLMKSAAGVSGDAAMVPGVRTRVLSVYHNGIIWTANPKVWMLKMNPMDA